MIEPQHGCDHAIRNDDNRNLFECMYMGDCIHKQVIDRRPLLYRCHCITAKESSDVLDELDEKCYNAIKPFHVSENGAYKLMRMWIAELKQQQGEREQG